MIYRSTSDLFRASLAAWSPDGQRIAAIAKDSGLNMWMLILMNADGSDLEYIRVDALKAALEWSPDSHWIALGGVQDELFVIDAAAGDVSTLATDTDLPARWLPDSSAVLYWRIDGTLGKAGLDGSTSTLGTLNHTTLSESEISPDASMIAYIAGESADDPSPDIYLANIDGSDARVLVQNPAPTVCFNP
jgi:Tol biopolymer transport system component